MVIARRRHRLLSWAPEPCGKVAITKGWTAADSFVQRRDESDRIVCSKLLVSQTERYVRSGKAVTRKRGGWCTQCAAVHRSTKHRLSGFVSPTRFCTAEQMPASGCVRRFNSGDLLTSRQLLARSGRPALPGPHSPHKGYSSRKLTLYCSLACFFFFFKLRVQI